MKMRHKATGFISADGSEIIEAGHERHNIGECDWCDYCRAVNIQQDFLWRLDHCGQNIHNLYMWSLGSSLHDTTFNRKTMRGHWTKFRTYFSKRGGFPVVFRVLETGRRGYLHFHFVATGFMAHAEVLAKWRSLTGEASNVHVSGQNGAQNPKALAKYLTKYLTKETSQYRWCGSFYGLGKERGRMVRAGRGSIDRMPGSFGELYYGYTTENDNKQHRNAQVQLPETSGGGEI